jgi:hypothetical protein
VSREVFGNGVNGGREAAEKRQARQPSKLMEAQA